MFSISFNIPGAPLTKLRPRFSRFKGKVRTYDEQSEEKETYRWQFKSRMSGINPVNSPIEIELLFYMKIPKSTSKKKRLDMISGETKHVKKPDCDNLVKMPLDCMNGIVYVDDSQIWKIRAEKLYSEEPRTEIKLKWR